MGASSRVWGNLVLLHPIVQLDPIGKVRLPTISGRVGRKTVLSPTLNRSLAIYPAARWEEVADDLTALPHLREEASLLIDLVRSNAAEATIDEHDRLWIPEFLRRLAGLEDDVLPVVASDHLELWDPRRWAARQVHSVPGKARHVVA